MNVLMIYPKYQYSFWGAKESLKKILHKATEQPPLGLLTIASYLPDDFQIRLRDRNVAEETEADWEWADVVFLSLISAQRDDYRICVANAKKHSKPIAVGGHYTHVHPEVVTADADWVCFQEAESIMDEFIDDLRADRRGKQYQGGNTTNMEEIKVPRLDLLPNINDYAVMPVQFSRGCPFNCEFCYSIEIYGRASRTKVPAQVLTELTAIKELGFEGAIFFAEDNFIGNKNKTKALLEELVVWNRKHKNPYWFFTEVTINLADEEELMNLMTEANFMHVLIGLETPDPKLLMITQKLQNIPGNPLQKLRKIREHGIHVMGGFIVGVDGEGRDVFETQRTFIQASGVGLAQIGLVSAIPTTQLFHRLQKEGRLLDKLILGGDHTVEAMNFIPKGELTKREYLEGYCKIMEEIYEPKAYFERILPAVLTVRKKLSDMKINYQQFLILIRMLYYIGIKARGVRSYFLKTFLQVMWKNPGALAGFYLDCYYFYHLIRYRDYAQRTIRHYLANPRPEDVLDTVMPASADTVTAA